MSTALDIGKKLVALCQEGKARQAMNELYSPDIVSIEAGGGNPNMPRRMQGLDAVNGKADWWEANNHMNSSKIEGPWPHDDRFIVRFTYNITPKSGPMAGKPMTIDEAALYTVQNGKITQEEFFYSM